MRSPIRFAVAGLGRISSRHIDAIKSCPDAMLTAVWDVHERNRMAYLSGDSTVKTFATFQQLLSDSDIDVVNICTPSGTHAELAIQTAKAHKHCILEKPMAMNAHEALQVIQAFKENNVSLLVSLQNRWNKPIQHVKHMQQKLGQQRYIAASCFWYRSDDYYCDWHGSKDQDGGVLFNQGSHYVDILLYLSGKGVKSVSAFGGALAHDIETDDTVTANLLFTDGTLGNIQVNTITYPEDMEGSLTLWYEKATIKIGGKALNEIVYWKGWGEETVTEDVGEIITDVYGNHHRTAIQNMVDHLKTGVPLFISGEDALASLACIEYIQQSIQQKGAVVTWVYD